MSTKWAVTLEDGRTFDVYAPEEAGAKKQANHQEMTRVVIANRLGLPARPDPSIAVAATKLKEDPLPAAPAEAL